MMGDPVFVMRNGHPFLVLLSVDQFEGLLETIEILSDRAFAQRLRKRLERAKAGGDAIQAKPWPEGFFEMEPSPDFPMPERSRPA